MTFLGLLRQWDRAHATEETQLAAVMVEESEKRAQQEAKEQEEKQKQAKKERKLERESSSTPLPKKVSPSSAERSLAVTPPPIAVPFNMNEPVKELHKSSWAKQQIKAYAGWTNYFLARGDSGMSLLPEKLQFKG